RFQIAAIALILLAMAIGGAVLVWGKFGSTGASSQTAATEPSAETADAAEMPANAAQVLKDLQTVQQQMAERLDDIQRQLAAEQGERKLLSDQVAALSSRVNGLSASNASATTGMALSPTAKKKPAPAPLRPQPRF